MAFSTASRSWLRSARIRNLSGAGSWGASSARRRKRDRNRDCQEDRRALAARNCHRRPSTRLEVPENSHSIQSASFLTIVDVVMTAAFRKKLLDFPSYGSANRQRTMYIESGGSLWHLRQRSNATHRTSVLRISFPTATTDPAFETRPERAGQDKFVTMGLTTERDRTKI